MLNYDMIYDRIAIINKAANRLEKIRNLSLKDFIQDIDNYAIAEHNLRIALEAIFDIGRHILVKLGLGKPEDYRQVLVLLGQNHILPMDFVDRIIGMAGYRNRLVHLYNEVSEEEIYRVIQENLDDIKDYAMFILKYIKESNNK